MKRLTLVCICGKRKMFQGATTDDILAMIDSQEPGDDCITDTPRRAWPKRHWPPLGPGENSGLCTVCQDE